MKSDPIVAGLEKVSSKWTRQRKAEERGRPQSSRANIRWGPAFVSLKDICYEVMEDAWLKASDGGRLPTHWRQVYYVARPLVETHSDSDDRELRDSTFKKILEAYLLDHRTGWDVVRGARGVFKEPHGKDSLALSTLGVRGYLADCDKSTDTSVPRVARRLKTRGPRDRFGAVLICEKEGFDELLQAEQIPERYDLALMSTKGISARAARDLAHGLGVPCFTLHDFDKNGFVMAAGFPFATDLGIRLEDIDAWDLEPERQEHKNVQKTYRNLRDNGATKEEAEFIANGQRVELNMFTGDRFIEYVEAKLHENEVAKVIPDGETLEAAWRRTRIAAKANKLIERFEREDAEPPPDDLAEQIEAKQDEDDSLAWDEALVEIADDGDCRSSEEDDS